MHIRKIFSWVLFVALLAGTIFTPTLARAEVASLQMRNLTLEKALPASPQANDTHSVCASGCEFSSIQAAIEAAVDGDTIDLASEIYTETITINKSVDLIGDGMDNTIIQAAGEPGVAADSVITVNGGYTITIESLTVRYGKSPYTYPIIAGGGGIFNQSRSLTISNTKVISNVAEQGGGIFTIDSGSITILDSVIEGNTASVQAGGIYIEDTDMSIVRSTVRDNALEGIYTAEVSRINIIDSLIEGNNGVGIYNDNALMNLENSSITNNGDGGILNKQFLQNFQGSLNIQDSKISDNGGRGISNYATGIATIATATISNTSISNNNGGGIYNGSIITLTQSMINNNISEYDGGGIYNRGTTTLINSTISGNYANSNGGGIYNDYTGTANLVNITISGNEATNNGGGIYNVGVHLGTQNCTISNNAAAIGGGIYKFSDDIVLNSSIIASSTGGDCVDDYGIIYEDGYNLVEDGSCGFPVAGDPLLDLLQDNGGTTWTHALLPGSPAIDAIPVAECSATTDQRSVARPQGSGCDIGAFELERSLTIVKSVDNPAPVPGEIITFTIQVTNNFTETVTEGVISDTLPTGLNSLDSITLEPPLSGTLGSEPPILVTGLTIGAGEQITVTLPISVSYGLAGGTIITNTAWVTSSEVLTPTIGSVNIIVSNAAPVAVNDEGAGFATANNSVITTPSVFTNDSDPNGDTFFVESYDTTGTLGLVTSNGDGTFDYDPNGQFDDLVPGEQATDTFSYTISDGALADTALVTITLQTPKTIYVDSNAIGDATGLSWTDAYTNIQDALATAINGNYIWVAEGVYYPDEGSGQTNGDRDAFFQLKNGVALYGGFPQGGGDGSFAARSTEAFTTTLSGDIGSEGSRYDNSHRIVVGSETSASAILDGFIVSDAYTTFGEGKGAGIFNENGNPTFRNLIIQNSGATGGAGGMYNDGSSPTLENVFIKNNGVYAWGGGMGNWNDSNPTLIDVTFRGNNGPYGGGGMYNSNSNPYLFNVKFEHNRGGPGAGIHNTNSDPILINVVFSNNDLMFSQIEGRGIANYNSSPILLNVTFFNNAPTTDFIEIFNYNSNITITNSILWVDAITPNIVISNTGTSTPIIKNSLIRYSGGSGDGWDSRLGVDGGGNIDNDPLFIRYPDDGNLGLKPNSPAIDTGDISTCPTTDIDGNPRPAGSGCDMGAFEFQPIEAGPNQITDEGTSLQFNGSAGIFESPDIHWDFDDGYTATGTLTPTHIYPDNGVFTVTLTVTDAHGTTDSDWLLVTVENVAPTLSAFPDLEITAGETITITSTITDPGVLDSQTVLITWETGATETIELATAERQFSAAHTYAAAGLYPVTVRVTDKDGDWDEKSFAVTVDSNGYWLFLPVVIR